MSLKIHIFINFLPLQIKNLVIFRYRDLNLMQNWICLNQNKICLNFVIVLICKWDSENKWRNEEASTKILVS